MTSWTPELRGRSGPLYLAIADALAMDIAGGRLTAGTRLPTHRELAERVGVTVGTVSRAYAEAERRGLIGGEVGRGTYVRHRESSRSFPEPTLGSADDALIELGLNWPATPPGDPAAQALRRTLEALQHAPNLPELLSYQPHAGLASHREAGAAWIGRFGWKVDPAQVVVCSGGQHAMEVALTALTRPGDTVLTEALTYPGMKVLANRLHLRLQGVAMDAQGLIPEALEAACRGSGARLLYCLPTLQNPTGGVMPRERRERIAAILRAQGLCFLEDDAYGSLLDERLPSLCELVPETGYFIAGVSKLLAPGLRISYLAAPQQERHRLTEAVGLATRMTPPLMAEIAARWLSDGTAEALVAGRRREAQERMGLARDILGEAALPSPLASGYHLWLRLPPAWRSEAFSAQARKAGVSVTSSDVFAVNTAVAPGAVRVCLGAPRTQALLEKGLRRLRDTLACGPEPLSSIV
ncbi:PLP-dependent aminotransferase family protein [Stigmatella sp. ncwal1]|uniref:PLP-dependent aminotransferase family protein n=1 Tax=Stigmatella ashevillensis TaxID=2995309 RepID=A0ABT5D6V6_9BACT|nr:PLP-dependent aminotransferase family protein [Stigmatella ashevillena]MDC0708868.1 PLP-dependent aminotransferase family protein [Stigmatella ashevillena]